MYQPKQKNIFVDTNVSVNIVCTFQLNSNIIFENCTLWTYVVRLLSMNFKAMLYIFYM